MVWIMPSAHAELVPNQRQRRLHDTHREQHRVHHALPAAASVTHAKERASTETQSGSSTPTSISRCTAGRACVMP